LMRIHFLLTAKGKIMQKILDTHPCILCLGLLILWVLLTSHFGKFRTMYWIEIITFFLSCRSESQ
jgi:hypothetical protein